MPKKPKTKKVGNLCRVCVRIISEKRNDWLNIIDDEAVKHGYYHYKCLEQKIDFWKEQIKINA